MSADPLSHARLVKEYAAALGFDACGVAEAVPADPAGNLDRWLGLGYHADMHWMEATRALRQEVRLKLPRAQSVIVVARNYYQLSPPRPAASGRVARYAWGRDYHRVLKKPLKRLAEYLRTLDPEAESFLSIDSGPVLERTWAARAGIGWVGKNSLILRRDLGSWFFLGAIVTTIPLAPDAPVQDHCGNCRACLDACPTGAIVRPQVVDSNRCISYQTIENRGPVPPGVAARMEDWVFGCDVCQEVCPWNRFAVETSEEDFRARPGTPYPLIADLLASEAPRFEAEFAGSPIRRAKHEGMQRNARIALANQQDGARVTAPEAVERHSGPAVP